MREIIKKFLALFSLKILKINRYESLINENSFLKENLNEKSNENSFLKENLNEKSNENNFLKEKLKEKSNENSFLKENLSEKSNENNFLKEKLKENQEFIFNELRISSSKKSINKIVNSNSFNVALINANIYSSKNKKIFSDIVETSAGNTGNSYIGEYLYRGFNKYNNVLNLQNNIFFDKIPDIKNLQNKDFIIFSFQDLLKDSLSYFGQTDPFKEWINILKKNYRNSNRNWNWH